jgi:outer membrane autotransporter protein
VFGRKKSRAGLGLTNGEAWLSPLGGWGEQSERNGAAGYDAKLYGMVAGADAEVAPDLRLGLAFAYTQSRIKSASDSTDNSLTVDGYEASIYGAWDVAEDISLLGGLSFGRNEFDGSRHMSFATLNRTARASYGGYAFSAETSVEKRFLVADALTFTPSVGLRYRASWDEGYAETGANALNLQVDGQQSRNLLSGVDGQLDYMLANGVELSANAGVAYDLINDRSRLTLAYQGASANPFQVDGAQGDPWTGHAGVGLKINLDSGVDINAAYQFGTGDGLSSHTAGLSAKFAF